MNIRTALLLIAGMSLLGASCAKPEAWRGSGNSGYVQTTPSVAPTTGPTQTIDQIDEDTKALGKDIDTEMQKNDGDVQGVSRDAQSY